MVGVMRRALTTHCADLAAPQVAGEHELPGDVHAFPLLLSTPADPSKRGAALERGALHHGRPKCIISECCVRPDWFVNVAGQSRHSNGPCRSACRRRRC